VVSNPYQAPHWSDPTKLSNYVDVEWEVGVAPENRLPTEALKEYFPGIAWDHMQGSGVMPNDKSFADAEPQNGSRLIAEWNEHLNQLGVAVQGRSRDVNYRPATRGKVRVSITRESVQAAIDRYREIGREAFLAESGGNKAFRYIIVEGDLEIDAKAIVLAAHNAAHPDQPLRANDFDGNRLTVAEPLRKLGFYVEDLREELDHDAPLGIDPDKYLELASRLKGSLDVTRTSGQRREQSILRGALGLYRDTTVQCGLCGKTYPSGFVVAGHIKKRSECTDAERLDVAHVAMPICVFGCDALFEKRYIKVINGSIVVTDSGIADVDTYLGSLEGRRAPGWTSEREKYFAWHSAQTVNGAG
jgi:hypothetical protein